MDRRNGYHLLPRISLRKGIHPPALKHLINLQNMPKLNCILSIGNPRKSCCSMSRHLKKQLWCKEQHCSILQIGCNFHDCNEFFVLPKQWMAILLNIKLVSISLTTVDYYFLPRHISNMYFRQIIVVDNGKAIQSSGITVSLSTPTAPLFTQSSFFPCFFSDHVVIKILAIAAKPSMSLREGRSTAPGPSALCLTSLFE